MSGAPTGWSTPRRPGWRRWVPRDAERLIPALVALIALGLALDILARLALDLVQGVTTTWVRHVVGVVSVGVIVLMVRHPLPAFAVWLVVAPFSDYHPMTVVAWMVLALRMAASRPWWQVTVVALCGTAFEVWSRVHRLGYTWSGAVATSVAAAVATVGLGLAARGVLRRRRSNLLRMADVVRESELLRQTEQAGLARDLHDGLATDLSLITLHAMSGKHSDPSVQRAALHEVVRAAESARAELRGLVSSLREDVTDPWGEHRSPSALAAQLTHTLSARGLGLTVDIDPRVEAVGGHVRETLLRVLKESATNIIRHAPAGSTATAVVRCTPGAIEVVVENPHDPGAPVHDLSTGWGLLGLRERISLLEGQFAAGAHEGTWRVHASIPWSEEP